MNHESPNQPNDQPLPLSAYQQAGCASRTTLWRWEKKGLRILHVGGKRFIRPSDWTAFIECQHGQSKKQQ